MFLGLALECVVAHKNAGMSEIDPEVRVPWRISADTGGTFTDVVARSPDGRLHRTKVLSSGVIRVRIRKTGDSRIFRLEPPGVPSGLFAGFHIDGVGEVRRHEGNLLEFAERIDLGDTVLSIPTGLAAPVLGAHWVMETPLAASLEPCLLRVATTRGTNALLERKGARVELFVTEGFEDLLEIGNQTRPDLFARRVWKSPSLAAVSRGLAVRIDRHGECVAAEPDRGPGDPAPDGRESAATVAVVSLCNGFRAPDREECFAKRMEGQGWRKVVAAARVSRMPGYLRRTETAVVEGYLAPVLDDYLAHLKEKEGVRAVEVMNSAGGIVPSERFRAVDSLLSGPAGGVAGAAAAGVEAGADRFLAFDMGGTSTDVSRFDGEPVYREELTVGPARIFADALRIDTVAAGGGSICGFDGYGFTVGPGSAGADPGPACYGAGGPLTLTDVHVLLGRIDPDRFRVPIDIEAARAAFGKLLEAAEMASLDEKDRIGVLHGFLAIANERMAGALRGISLRDGHDPASFDLVSFGGAGGLHACGLAKLLGMNRILQPAAAGILSAEGLDQARPESMIRRPILKSLEGFEAEAPRIFGRLEKETLADIDAAADAADIRVKSEAFLRIQGQEATIACEWNAGTSLENQFLRRFEEIFGFEPPAPSLEVESVRVRARRIGRIENRETFVREEQMGSGPNAVFHEEDLRSGRFGTGPCVIAQEFGTLFVEEGWCFEVGSRGSLRVERAETKEEPGREMSAPVEVEHELFRRRFDGVVKAMGGQLERTALSVNIRERLDFSCALLDREGNLVVNAPHIPVHLGAMGTCIRSISKQLDWRPGDIAVTNHPAFGGSHLPDLTVVAPVFDGGDLQCFVAVRAHHAEIGGVRPGSMPPDAKSLAEEGVVLPPFHLFRKNDNRMEELRKRLVGEGGAAYPSRDPDTNLADVLSQVAAVRVGAGALEGMIRAHGSKRIDFFFKRILSQSEEKAQRVVAGLSADVFGRVLHEDLDGGGRISVRAERDESGRLVLDFGGTSPGVGSFQCPEGVSLSAILYVVRLLVDEDVPLNEGLLRSVDCRIPGGCLLSADFSDPDPSRQPPVVAGNVEVSQRLVSLLVRLFGLGAGSQATMNNVVFGGEGFSHYETLGGGAGANESGVGASAVQVHMTNTAITDPEILEQRFPVRLERFAIRRGSGGAGRFVGGEGIVREYRFEAETELSLLTQQRTTGPLGAQGGAPGTPGRQTLLFPDGKTEILPFAATVKVPPGTRLIVESPGGGGFGKAD